MKINAHVCGIRCGYDQSEILELVTVSDEAFVKIWVEPKADIIRSTSSILKLSSLRDSGLAPIDVLPNCRPSVTEIFVHVNP
jgi:hypothetical protein